MTDLLDLQNAILDRVAAGQSIIAIAAELGIPRTTIHHWKRTDPDFADAVRDAQEDAAAHTRALCAPHLVAALAVLVALMSDPATPPSIRYKAAQFLLTQGAAPQPKPLTTADRRDARLRRMGLDPQTEPATYTEYKRAREVQDEALLAEIEQLRNQAPTSTDPQPTTPTLDDIAHYLQALDTELSAREQQLAERQANTDSSLEFAISTQETPST